MLDQGIDLTAPQQMDVAGARMPMLSHATRDKQIYVLDGELTVTIDGAESIFTFAGFVRIPRGSDHSYVNRGTAAVHAMFWALPSRRLADAFDKLEAPPTWKISISLRTHTK